MWEDDGDGMASRLEGVDEGVDVGRRMIRWWTVVVGDLDRNRERDLDTITATCTN